MMEQEETSPPKRGATTLNARDLSVVKKIADVGLAGFDYLRQNVLAGCTIKHAQYILNRLVKDGYLFESYCDCGRVLGWRTNFASSKVQDVIGQVEELRSTVPLVRTAFRHNQILNELRDLYLSSPAIKGWVKEVELKKVLMTKAYRLSSREHEDRLLGVPDGMLILKTSDRDLKIAFEIELTQKSGRRIKKKLESYITSKHFDFSFFVVEGEALKNRFIYLYREILRSSAKVEFSVRKNGIYFAELTEIQRLGLTAPFSSLKNTVAVSDFH